MLPSDLLREIATAVQEVDGIHEVLTYEPTIDLVTRPTAWVDIENLGKANTSIADYWDADATIKVVVAVPRKIDTKTSTWDLAWAVASHLDSQRWGALLTDPAVLVRVDRAILADFGDDLDACEIELLQYVRFAKLNPAFAGDWLSNPSEAWLSTAPDIGIPNIPKYDKISEYP